MADINRQYAYFTITGSFDPVGITKLVGVNPTECWEQGDPHPSSPAKRRFSRWSLHSRLSDVEPVEKHVGDVLDQLDKNVEGFIHISQLYNGTLQIVGHFYTNYPGWGFDSSLILVLARYSLRFDFDFYEYHSNEIDAALN